MDGESDEIFFDNNYWSTNNEREEEFMQEENRRETERMQNATQLENNGGTIITGNAMRIESRDLSHARTLLVCRRTNACPLHRTRKKRCPAEWYIFCYCIIFCMILAVLFCQYYVVFNIVWLCSIWRY